MVQVLEITNLPLLVTEKKIRTWLEKQIGGELCQEIKYVGLMSDVECFNIRESRTSGMMLAKSHDSQSNALNLCCFLGFNTPEALDETLEAL